jgi:phosphohistidine phosphatase
MKRLALLRHAEAEPARPNLSDAARCLTARGRLEARDSAQCIARAGLHIDALWVSPAERTRETALILIAELAFDVELQFDSDLYLGTPEILWQALRRCQDSLHTVLMIGHNPGLSEFARQFCRDKSPVDLRTAGLCSIEFNPQACWRSLSPESATLFHLLR